jgi:hypothetical protein
MSLEHPLVLYVGAVADGDALHEEASHFDWYIYRPTKTLEALAMLVTYMPDVVILDHLSAPGMAEEVFAHLTTNDWFKTPLLVVSRQDTLWGATPVVSRLNNPIHLIHSLLERQQDEPILEGGTHRRTA